MAQPAPHGAASAAASGSVTGPAGPDVPDPLRVRLGAAAAARCRRRVHLDAASTEQRTVAAAALRAMDELAEHREMVLRAIRTEHDDPPAVDSWRTRPEPIVVSPMLPAGIRAGAPDLLVWAGDGYLPVIIRAHRTRDAGDGAKCAPVTDPLSVWTDPQHRARRHRSDRLALAHHYRQLTDLGCASTTVMGGVIGRGSRTDGAGPSRPADGPEDDATVIVWHPLDAGGSAALQDYDRRFADRLAIARAAAAGLPPLAFPSRIGECRRCQWWPRCSAELRATGDISLLLTGDDVQVARAAGVGTIEALASLSPAGILGLARALAQPAHVQVRARAWQAGIPLVRMDHQASIRRADVEIDVDAESYGEDGAYLWGALLSGADVGLAPGYRSFVTWDRLPSPAQGAAFGSFFDHLMQVRAAAAARGLSFAAFCYGKAAEERWMLGLARRYAGAAGVPDEGAVTGFCASPQWVDLLLEIRRQFVLPGSLRLKALAAEIGFSWRDPEPGGENSLAWYRAAIGTDAGKPSEQRPAPDNPMAQRLLCYNEDDVQATLALRRWLTARLTQLPTVADLEGVSGAASAATRPAG